LCLSVCVCVQYGMEDEIISLYMLLERLSIQYIYSYA
jgi:hypothetical protein